MAIDRINLPLPFCGTSLALAYDSSCEELFLGVLLWPASPLGPAPLSCEPNPMGDFAGARLLWLTGLFDEFWALDVPVRHQEHISVPLIQ
ncbi:MAG: hypothetical protein HC767_03575 [Akkermansiaceae bacterium]|nr:hypothetical protein [Akkermansiaceae bacterium]